MPRSLHGNHIKCYTLTFYFYIYIYTHIYFKNNLFLKPFYLIMIPRVRFAFSSIFSFSMDQNLDLFQRHQSIYWPEVTHWRILALIDCQASNQLLEVLYQLRSETAKSLYANFQNIPCCQVLWFYHNPWDIEYISWSLSFSALCYHQGFADCISNKKITSLTLMARNKSLKALDLKLQIRSNLFN